MALVYTLPRGPAVPPWPLSGTTRISPRYTRPMEKLSPLVERTNKLSRLFNALRGATLDSPDALVRIEGQSDPEGRVRWTASVGGSCTSLLERADGQGDNPEEAVLALFVKLEAKGQAVRSVLAESGI